MDRLRKQPLMGIVPPLVTPLSRPDTLDVPGLERLLEHVLAGGVHGVFVLGTTGEAPSLSHPLRRELVERACRQVAGRVPVLVGITDTAVTESLDLAYCAADAGADALVAAPPYYFPAGQPELLDYYRQLVHRLPLPLYLYNMPAMTKVVIEPETLAALADGPGIAGVKDSSGDLSYFDRVLAVAAARPDWSVLIGPEHLLSAAMARGGHGGVNGGANVRPRLYVDLFEAARRGDEERVARLHARVEEFGQLYRIGRHASAIIKGLKCALSLLGICDDVMAAPFEHFHAAEREQVRRLLRDWELIR